MRTLNYNGSGFLFQLHDPTSLLRVGAAKQTRTAAAASLTPGYIGRSRHRGTIEGPAL
jgi:hypothetical protein